MGASGQLRAFGRFAFVRNRFVQSFDGGDERIGCGLVFSMSLGHSNGNGFGKALVVGGGGEQPRVVAVVDWMKLQAAQAIEKN